MFFPGQPDVTHNAGKFFNNRLHFHLPLIFQFPRNGNAGFGAIGNMLNPTGPVRVSLFEDMYNSVLRGVFSDFASMWPGIQLHVNFNERPVDLMTDPYDVDFRNGPLTDSSLKARKVITFETYLYAAPKLLEVYQTPSHPDELRTMPYISPSDRTQRLA
jgi:DNA-binding transcriptional LysR family regulator